PFPHELGSAKVSIVSRRSRKMRESEAVRLINESGALLVFPIDNRPEPASLWSGFFPRSQMRWEWDDGGDDRVHRLWHLRAELSTTRKVIYTKWYRGRATYLSIPLFRSMLRALNPEGLPGVARRTVGLSSEARSLL